MKKIVTSIGIAVLVMFMFFKDNNISNTKNIDLTSLINLSTANAEGSGTTTCNDYCYSYINASCSFSSKDKNGYNITVTCHDMNKILL